MNVCYHSATYGGFRHSGCVDIMAFVFYVTLQDNVFQALSDFLGRSSSIYVTILLRLVALGTRHCSIGNTIFLVCHWISQNHVIKELYDFMVRSPSSRSLIMLPSLVAICIMVVEI